MADLSQNKNPELEGFFAARPGRDLDRGGLKLHFLEEGQGEPVVTARGSRTWSCHFGRLGEGLAPVCRTIVPVHIGCGLADKPDDSRYHYTLSRRVDDLEGLLDHLGIEQNINLIVHDWGGMIGLTYAARY